MSTTGIHIGHSEKGIEAYGKQVLEILKANQSDHIKEVALNALKKGCQINNTTLRDSTITMQELKEDK
tara:strand:- start:6854 stop:7057 length:204 start_codon:yes stop_codon:yes gene_type:complete